MTAHNHRMHDIFNREKQYDCDALKESVQMDVPLLNRQQKHAYDTLRKVVNDGTGGIFILVELEILF